MCACEWPCVTVVLRVRKKTWAKVVGGEAVYRTACVCGGGSRGVWSLPKLRTKFDAVETVTGPSSVVTDTPTRHNGVRSDRTAG